MKYFKIDHNSEAPIEDLLLLRYGTRTPASDVDPLLSCETVGKLLKVSGGRVRYRVKEYF